MDEPVLGHLMLSYPGHREPEEGAFPWAEGREAFHREALSLLRHNHMYVVAWATALHVLEIIEKEKVVEQAAYLGIKLRRRLDEFFNEFEIIGEVRRKGPMLALELVKDRATKEPYPPDC